MLYTVYQQSEPRSYDRGFYFRDLEVHMTVEVIKINFDDTYVIRHEVMWPDRELDCIKLEFDPEGLHYGVQVDGILVSVISLFISDRDQSAQFRKFATLKTYQGQGYGGILLSKLIEDSKERKIKRLWCNARLDATGLYEKYGLKKTDQTFNKGGQSYVIMEVNFK